MPVSRRRHRIVIQSTTQTRDAVGGITDSWATHVSAWASVEPMQVGSREWLDAQKIAAEVTHRVRMRWQDGITPKMRISWDSRLFDILQVLNRQERSREAVLLVKETV